jgi:hypothetical protein
MVENTSLTNSKTSSEKKEFEENSYCLITHGKMGSQRGRTKRWWVQYERCCMIRAYQRICGRKHATLQFMCKTIVLIEYLA